MRNSGSIEPLFRASKVGVLEPPGPDDMTELLTHNPEVLPYTFVVHVAMN